MARTGWRDRGPVAVVAIGATALLILLGMQALAAASRGDDVLGAGAALVASAIAAASAIDATLERLVVLRLPACALVVGAFAVTWARGRELAPLARGLGALVLAWAGHTLLAEARFGAGAFLSACAGVAYLARAAPAPPLDGPLRPRVEIPALLGLVVVCLALGLHRLDVHPPLYFDEAAYLMAARMGSGGLEPGPLELPGLPGPAYSFERLRMQALPFSLQALAVGALPTGILPLRLLSLAASVAALLVAAATVRAQLGARTALVMTALCCSSALFLGYGRPGFYLSFSPLHAIACFAIGLRLAQRWDARSALLLGILLGSSPYFYQISWFAPLLTAGAVVAARPRCLWSRRSVGRGLLVAASAIAVLLPGVPLLRSGFGEVAAQTFSHAAWAGTDAITVQLVKPGATLEDLAALADRSETSTRQRLRLRTLRVRVRTDGSPALRVRGRPEVLEATIVGLEADGWRVQWRRAGALRWLQNALDMSSLLFVAPSQESATFWIAAPIVEPLVAALFFLGLLEALRRRSDPSVRALLVWVIGAAFLPGALGNALPRRAILMQPLVFALASLPLVSAASGSSPRGERRRLLGAVAVAAILLAAATGGVHAYFTQWYWRAPPLAAAGSEAAPQSGGGALDLVKLVNASPRDEAILIPPVVRYTGFFLDLLHEEARPSDRQRVFFRRRATSPDIVGSASCRFRTPLTWITSNTPDQRVLFDGLRRDFVVKVEPREGFRVVRLVRRRRDGCRGGDGP